MTAVQNSITFSSVFERIPSVGSNEMHEGQNSMARFC